MHRGIITKNSTFIKLCCCGGSVNYKQMIDISMNLIRLLEQESSCLASYAMHSKQSEGRVFKQNSQDYRLPFQKDRDRIIHCKAFRRLNEKTQVFTAGSGDHYRTRLTHSIEVGQVARDICRRLQLNEDLAEAIALAHDLGHPPFAHAGQDILHEIMQKFGLHFEHNEQSKRIVEKLEKTYPEFDGLNLTVEVLDGLMKHHSPYDQPKTKFAKWSHLEAQVVNLADEIAYTNHDVDDGVRSGIITHAQLTETNLWQKAVKAAEQKHGLIENEDVRHYRSVSSLHSMMIDDLTNNTIETLAKHNINSLEDVRAFDGVLVTFSDAMKVELSQLRSFLYKNFYLSETVVKQFEEAKKIMQTIFDYYLANLNKLPLKYQALLEENESKEIVVKDYLAGMTDGFMMREYEKLI